MRPGDDERRPGGGGGHVGSRQLVDTASVPQGAVRTPAVRGVLVVDLGRHIQDAWLGDCAVASAYRQLGGDTAYGRHVRVQVGRARWFEERLLTFLGEWLDGAVTVQVEGEEPEAVDRLVDELNRGWA